MNQDEKRKHRHDTQRAREAKNSYCMVCGGPVTIEDRCVDEDRVTYLHRACGYATQTYIRIQKGTA